MTTVAGLNPTESYSSLTGGNAAGPNDIISDHQGNCYIFVQASGSIAQYDVVAISSTGIAQALTKALADTGVGIGVACATLSSASYGWAQIEGVTSVNVLQTCSSSIALYTSGTAGKLDDTTTSQTKIAGLVILSNNTTTATQAIVGMMSTRPFAAL